ncbi:MAG: hypothetical protein HQL80_07200, partial [Magnetococcales bacterium]|nr:hypothetical protein [Magnetococcales bacterium]
MRRILLAVVLLLPLLAGLGHAQDNLSTVHDSSNPKHGVTQEKYDLQHGESKPLIPDRAEAPLWYQMAQECTVSDYEYQFAMAFMFGLKIWFVLTALTTYRL